MPDLDWSYVAQLALVGAVAVLMTVAFGGWWHGGD